MLNPVCGLAFILAVAFAPARPSLAAEESGSPRANQPGSPSARLIERGRYLAKIAGCNDCHTPGY
jgi:hypothetical protein